MPRHSHFSISAPSGAGKGTITESLVRTFKEILKVPLHTSISAASRAMRPGEVDGRDYHFFSEQIFRKKIKEKSFLEWNEYSGNLYGTLSSETYHIINSNELLNLTAQKVILFEVDINGALKLKKIFKDEIITFFLDTPIQEVEKRLRKRNTETEAEIQNRLSIAKDEIAKMHECDHVIPYGEGAIPDYVANKIANLTKIKAPQYI